MVFAYMLMLLFQIADESWAIAVSEVKDLIPLVTLQPYSGATFRAEEASAEDSIKDSIKDSSHERTDAHIFGLLNYHGEHLPVIDIAQLIARQRAPSALSTRIAIVELAATGDAAPQKRGLILDRAYETAYLSKNVDLPANSPYVDATLEGPNGIVQQLATAKLF